MWLATADDRRQHIIRRDVAGKPGRGPRRERAGPKHSHASRLFRVRRRRVSGKLVASRTANARAGRAHSCHDYGVPAWVVWLIVAGVLAGAETLSLDLTLIMCAGGAGAASLAAALGAAPVVQVLVAVIVAV